VTASLLSEAQLGDLLAGFAHSARRFETRERYNSDVGREAFRRFLAGEADDYAWHRPWLDRIARDRSAGRSWQRIRVVSLPPSDYTRYSVGIARLNVAAGEDIHYLDRAHARRLGLDPLDGWLLDDQMLIHLLFDDRDDTFVGARVVDDETVVQRHRWWWSLGLRHASGVDAFARDFR
jgi:hypothetical protein